jgi:NAD(P)H dehydrogenase (quinone)
MEGNQQKRVIILFYSMYGHVETLAKSIAEGANSVNGVKAELWRIPETLPEEVLKKMHAKVNSDDIPTMTYDKIDELTKADGILFGMPTRFGMMSAQVKSFFDSTGGLWTKGALIGKPAGLFMSVGGQGGGQETTALTAITQFAHHGMVYVPVGYGMGHELYSMDEIRGGCAYGSGTYAGADGSRIPSSLELKLAKYQGEQFANFVNKLK